MCGFHDLVTHQERQRGSHAGGRVRIEKHRARGRVGIVAIGLSDEPLNRQEIAQNAHGSLGDTSPGSQFRGSERAIVERGKDAEFHTRFQRSTPVVRGDRFPDECRIRL